jgi:soluble lytic murein transglycosylase-like protein
MVVNAWTKESPMKAITQNSRHLPNKYGGFYTSLNEALSYLSDISIKTNKTKGGTLLDIINDKQIERNTGQHYERDKMERTKFKRQLNLQQTIRYGAILYIVAILATIPASVCNSSHQSVRYQYQASTHDLIRELIRTPSEFNLGRTTLAARLGMVPPSRMKAPRRKPYHSYIAQASQVYEVDSTLIRAIIMVESGYNPRAVSHRGARGLMQLMPTTARWLGVQDAFNPALNIDGGVRYFKRLLNRFDGDIELALAAYNAGSRYVHKYGGVPPFKATRIYIKKVLRYQQLYNEEMALNLTDLWMS